MQMKSEERLIPFQLIFDQIRISSISMVEIEILIFEFRVVLLNIRK